MFRIHVFFILFAIGCGGGGGQTGLVHLYSLYSSLAHSLLAFSPPTPPLKKNLRLGAILANHRANKRSIR